MDALKQQSGIEDLLQGKVLQKQRFGRSDLTALWIEMNSMEEVARLLTDERTDPEKRMPWLDNLSAMQMEEALVFTYFLRSEDLERSILLRVSVKLPSGPKAATEYVEAVSVRKWWITAAPFESEIEELFGVAYRGIPVSRGAVIPAALTGFPLRKNYKFPGDVNGISHARAAIGPAAKESSNA